MGNNGTKSAINSLNDFYKFKQLFEKSQTLKNNILNYRDKERNTVLHLACIGKHQECIKYLLDQGMNIYDENSNGIRALDFLLEDLRLFRPIFDGYIIGRSISQEKKSNIVRSYLFNCMEKNNRDDLTKYLISFAKENIFGQLYDKIFMEEIGGLLMASIRRNYAPIYKNTVELNIKYFDTLFPYFVKFCNFTDESKIEKMFIDLFECKPLLDCKAPVITSVQTIYMLNFLTANGFSVNQKDNNGDQIIHHIHTKNIYLQNKIVHMYSQNGYSYNDLDDGNGNKFIQYMNSLSSDKWYRFIGSLDADYGESIECNGYSGTLLHHIIRLMYSKKQYHALKYISEKTFSNTSIVIEDSNGKTFIEMLTDCVDIKSLCALAISNNVPPFVKIKLKSKIFGCTDKEISKCHIDNLLQLNLSDEEKKKITLIMLKYGSVATLEAIIQSPGFDINWQYDNGMTLLMHSVRLKKLSATKKIKQHNANLAAVDNEGRTAFNHAHAVGASMKLTNMVNPNPKTKGKKAVHEYYVPKPSAPPAEGADLVCKICMENKIQILYLPCKHALVCNTCYSNLKKKHQNKCFMCSQKVDYAIDFNI